MPDCKLEHVNITVSDTGRSARKLMDIFGWVVRWEGSSSNGGHSIHVGTDSQYIALYSPPDGTQVPTRFAKSMPLNHICIEVEDLGLIEARVKEAGFTPFNHADYQPGRRFYYFDDDGIEFEIVSYA